jgi:hypothetical protein
VLAKGRRQGGISSQERLGTLTGHVIAQSRSAF